MLTKKVNLDGLGYRELFDNSANQVTSQVPLNITEVTMLFLPVGMIWYINNFGH